MRVLAAAQAAEVFDHEQRMLVDRIDVIKVVLHLSDHVTPGRQHAPENGPGIHHHEGVIRAFFELQNLKKGCLVSLVVAVGGADFRRSMPKRAKSRVENRVSSGCVANTRKVRKMALGSVS